MKVKPLRGVARVCTAATPLARSSGCGLVSVTSSSAVGGVVAVATLRADNFCEGELTIMAAMEEGVPMIVARHTFRFDSEPIYGIAKLVWAGVGVVGVMSSSGEVLCVFSGLRRGGGSSAADGTCSEESCGDSVNSTEDVDERPFVRAEAHAVDICAMTVGGCPVLVTACNQKTCCYVFSLRNRCAEEKYERRTLDIGPFNAVAAVDDCHGGSALLVGCMLGCVHVFRWGKSPLTIPVVMRTILIGPSTRYIGLSVGTLWVNKTERSITFCAFGGTTTKKEENVFSVSTADGAFFEMRNTSDSVVEHSLSSWNSICRDAPGRANVAGPSLMVLTQPLSHCATSVEHHALVVTLTQPCTGAGNSGFVEGLGEADGPLSSSSFSIKVMEARSSDCLRALAMFTLNVNLLSTLRLTKKSDESQLMEFCLCDGKHAIFFDITDKTRLVPSSVLSFDSGHNCLVGMAWLPNATDVLVLLGNFLSEAEKLNKHGEKAPSSTTVVGNLSFSSREPLLWEGNDALTPLTLAQVRDVVHSICREESEKLICFIDKRLSALERSISALIAECHKKKDENNEGVKKK